MELRDEIKQIITDYYDKLLLPGEAAARILAHPTIRDALAHKREYDARRPTDFDTLNARMELARFNRQMEDILKRQSEVNVLRPAPADKAP